MNRINQALVLEDGNKYAIFKQAIYKGDNYYAVVKLTENEEDITDDYKILHEIKEEEKVYVEEVTDPATFELVAKYLDLLEK